MNSHLIIRLCRHTFSDGRHCQGAAVRGRACCRHHRGTRTRLHNMARARRLACIPRLCVPMNRHDLALNRAEVLRVVTSGAVDFATARLMLWAMDLTAAALPAQSATRRHSAHNPNIFYYVPITHHKCLKTQEGRGGGCHLTLDLETQPEFFQQLFSPCSESRVT